jgi:S1-C subfamily serine protease
MKPRDLLKKKNVVLYYTGKKETGGADTGRTAIRVGVKEKVPLAQLKKKDIIPRSLQGMETDVFPTEEISALAIDRKAKHRPAPGGVSIGHPSVTAGTLGMVVRKAGRRYILSNNHVLANSNNAKIGDDAWQPGSYDGGGIAECIGHLSEFVPIGFTGDGSGCLGGIIGKLLIPVLSLFGFAPRDIINKVDAAIARPSRDEDVSDEILEIGKPIGYGEAKNGDNLKKSGRTTDLTRGDVIATDGVSNVNYGDGRMAIFGDQIITSAMSEGGDSGSAVLNEQNEAVGLLFAGSSSLTIINKIANVIDSLGLDKT